MSEQQPEPQAVPQPPLLYTESVLPAQVPLEVTGTTRLTFSMVRP